MPENAVNFILYVELVAAVKASRGWFSRIARESGCRRVTLRRMAAELDYDPPVSEIEKIRDWYRAHGVPEGWPRRASGEERPSSEA